jgi:hypothetical protein
VYLPQRAITLILKKPSASVELVWKVKAGASVQADQAVAAVEIMDDPTSPFTSHVTHIDVLAPCKGIVVSPVQLQKLEPNELENEIGIIEYCLHEIVFKGLCADCGDDVY